MAAKKAAAKKAPAKKSTGGTPPPAKRGRATKGPTAQSKPAPERGRQTTAAKRAPEKGRQTTAAPRPGRTGQPAQAKGPNLIERAAKPKPGATYHRWILAEFVAAGVLAVIGGILQPRKRADGTPTWVHLIVQLTAVAFVYFVLALLSASDKVGKVAAAFGLLVLLGVLLNSTQALKDLGKIFAPTKTSQTAAPAGQ